jgi:hypothetical protein
MSKADIAQYLFCNDDGDEHPSCLDDAENVLQHKALKVKRCRNSSKRRMPILKKDAPWQKMLDGYVKGDNHIGDPESVDGKYFRRRFRMPYFLF